MHERITSWLNVLFNLTGLLIIFSGCSATDVPTNQQSVILNVSGLPPSRPGEVYALWVETPLVIVKSAGTNHPPQHTGFTPYLVSTFSISPDGSISGFDTTGFSNRLGNPFSVIVRGEISVEPWGNVGNFPTSILIAGNVEGTSDTGTAHMTAADPFAFGPNLNLIKSKATLASSPSAPDDYKGEFYLMTATNYDDAGPSLSIPDLGLPNGWLYGLWSVDSAAIPPLYTFITNVNAAGEAVNPPPHHFPFPGGRTPADSALPVHDLTKGTASIIFNLEPHFPGSDRSRPFAVPLLIGKIPNQQDAFSPFDLQNVADKIPTGTLKVKR